MLAVTLLGVTFSGRELAVVVTFILVVAGLGLRLLFSRRS